MNTQPTFTNNRANSSFTLDPATPAQAAQITQFFNDAMADMFHYFPQEARTAYQTGWSAKQIEQKLAASHLLYGAWENDTLAGLVYGPPPEGGVGTIIWLMVSPTYQNKQLGAALLQQAYHYYRRLNAHKIKLTVHDERAVQFYLRNGFFIEGVHEKHWWQLRFTAIAYELHPNK